MSSPAKKPQAASRTSEELVRDVRQERDQLAASLRELRGSAGDIAEELRVGFDRAKAKARRTVPPVAVGVAALLAGSTVLRRARRRRR